MKTEVEVKFVNINIEQIRRVLKDAGAVLQQPMRLMRRVLIEEPHHTVEHSFIRIRDEGDKITLTFKRRTDPQMLTATSVKEIEVEVSDFDDTVTLFSEAGWHYVTIQENRRETWTLDDSEVVIDEWPWLNPYIEIEGASESQIKAAAKKLGLDWKNVEYGHVDMVYEYQYTFKDGFRGIIDLPAVRFNDSLPAQFVPKRISVQKANKK